MMLKLRSRASFWEFSPLFPATLVARAPILYLGGEGKIEDVIAGLNSLENSGNERRVGMDEIEVGQGGGNLRRTVTWFLVGLVLGVVVTAIAVPRLGRRLPEAVRGKYESLQGPVTAKERQDDRLLLTIVTPAGAILATFKKQVAEISLLVERGDTVELAVPGYQPFLENPEIARVAKPMQLYTDTASTPTTQDEPAPDSAAFPVDSLMEMSPPIE
jgi:hypothetical protein